jgi:hypothetical protein
MFMIFLHSMVINSNESEVPFLEQSFIISEVKTKIWVSILFLCTDYLLQLVGLR